MVKLQERNVDAQFGHTIVRRDDKRPSAILITEALGLSDPAQLGSMLVVLRGRGIPPGAVRGGDPVPGQHYAVLVSEEEFDQAFAFIRDRGIAHWAAAGKEHPGEIYRCNGGRGVYVEAPDGHLLEVMTQRHRPTRTAQACAPSASPSR